MSLKKYQHKFSTQFRDLLTHPDKILFPESGITKKDIADYYISIHEWILPHIINRPLTLVRCPDGISQECFFQKHADSSRDNNIHLISKDSWVYIKDMEGLIGLVQLDVLEFHAWGCTVDNIEKPDRIIFDLDPHQSIAWSVVQSAAKILKKHLKQIGLESFVKTSGGKGLHVVVPILPDWPWDQIKDFAHAIAKVMEQQYPDIFISNMSKAKREGKIFLDYLRNGRGATTVVAYSTRAKPHAPVSTPLKWSELKPNISSQFYTISNLPKRLAKLKEDPWEGSITLEQKLNI